MNRKNRYVYILGVTGFYALCESVLLKEIYLIDTYDNSGMFLGPVNGIANPAQMLWWLMLYMPVWGVCGWLISQNYERVFFTIYRFRNIKNWWALLIAKICILNNWYYILMCFLIRYLTDKSGIKDIYQLVLLIMCHSFLMVMMMCIIFVKTRNMVISFSAIIMMETFSGVPIVYGWIDPKLWIPVWGMYGYSHQVVGRSGFEWSCAIIGQLMVSFVIIMLPIVFKKILIGSFGYEKNRISKHMQAV